MSRMGAIAHGGQLPPLSPPERVDKGRNLRQVPSERSVARERLNSHLPALRGPLAKVASLPVLVGICIIGGGTTWHD